MMITVVMATYNGEKFIQQQIESIYNQTRKPDQVLIYDDGSTDRTCDIMKSFICANGLENEWKLIINDENKGVVKNFVEGALDASGDIVFYSDQDDVWDERKIELMEKGFNDYPDMLACYCLRHLIDSDGEHIPVHFDFMTNVSVKKRGFQKVSLCEAVRFNKSPGLCLAIRKSLIKETSEMILKYHLTHDLPIGTVAAIHDGYYVINQKLVYYRQHQTNVSAPRYSVESRLSDVDKQIEGRIIRLNQMKAIYDEYHSIMKKKDVDNMNKAIISTQKSIDNLRKGNLFRLLLSVFDRNPMMNKWIALNNAIVCFRSSF